MLFCNGGFMQSLIQLSISILLFLSLIQGVRAEEQNIKENLSVISIYQIEDDVKAGFDFFTSRKTHKCGGKLSNRHRSYSDHKEVAQRKFELLLAAINFQHKVSIKSLGCEGRALLVDYVGISRGNL
jgi:stage III sporulation protein SpoIIIAA